MSDQINMLLTEYVVNSHASQREIEAVEETFGVLLPEDYTSFLETYGGGEGFIGDQYLIIWNANELVPFNEEYEVGKYAPGLLIFGSNGGGEGFAFDLRQKEKGIVVVPFVGMDLQYAIPIAETFSEFLHKLKGADGELF